MDKEELNSVSGQTKYVPFEMTSVWVEGKSYPFGFVIRQGKSVSLETFYFNREDCQSECNRLNSVSGKKSENRKESV